MKGMHGIIFSYEKKTGLRELIEHRIHGSIPIGGDYRVVDFMLSNMVNAGVQDVGIIMQGKCQSMLDHLSNGKSWDLSRKHGGLTLLPAFAYAENRGGIGKFRGKVEALAGVRSYLDTIRQDYIRTVRSKGATESRVIWGHAIKNALIPVVQTVGGTFATLLGGAIVTESLFSLPGLGSYIVNGVKQRDVPVVMGGVLTISVLHAVVILAVDVINAMIDPRIKAKLTKKR
mgnify:CR=1 FL=1